MEWPPSLRGRFTPFLSGGGGEGKKEKEENIQVLLNPHRGLQPAATCALHKQGAKLSNRKRNSTEGVGTVNK